MSIRPQADHLSTPTVEHKLEIQVCRGPNCSAAGSIDMVDWCRGLAEAKLPLVWQEVGCTGNCSEAPVVCWNACYLTEMTTTKLTTRLIDESWFV